MRRYSLQRNISRLMAVLLVLMLLAGAFPVALAAESGTCGADLSWSFDEGTLTITGSGDMTDFPENTMSPWYHLREEILKISLPEGLTSVGSLAFYECKKLTAVVIPNSVSRIGDYAFANCTGIELLNLGSGVENIGECAFSDCYKVASLTLPKSLKTIGVKTFYRCESITTLTVPSSVTGIGTEAFGYCKALVTADIQAQLRTIPDLLFYGCDSLVSVKLPDSATSVGEYAFRGCDQLATVYYDGEEKTPDQIQQIVDQDVPGFNDTGNVTGGNETDVVISGTATENPDGSVTQENTSVNRGDHSTTSTIITNTHPEDSLTGDITTDITITIEEEEGWDEATDAVKDALKGINDAITSTGSTSQPTEITVYVKDAENIDEDFVDALAGRDVTVTIITQDGSIWQIKGTDVDTKTEAESYDLRYEVTPGSAELCEELGTTKCYVVRFLAPAQINAEVMILLNPSLSLQNATLFERREELTTIQSSVIDMDGYAHFYLASVAEDSEYYIALNMKEAEGTAIVPEVVQTAYGKPEYVEPIKYEITGRKSSWGMTFNQVTWIMAGVLGGCVVIVGIVMFVLNKRKLRMGYVPEWDDEEIE